jgi:conjugal transfer pilin signal peptidase TrbI
MRLKQKLIAILLMFAVFGISLEFLIPSPLYKFRTNRSESLPYRLFFAAKFDWIVRKEGYVCFKHHYCPTDLVKQIKGVPGDSISYKDGHIVVDSFDCGVPLPKSPRSGIELHPIQEGIIPQGFVYVYAPHQESFDSRYEEFGLVKIEDLEEVAWPLL